MVKEDSIGRYQHQDGKDDRIFIAVEFMKMIRILTKSSLGTYLRSNVK